MKSSLRSSLSATCGRGLARVVLIMTASASESHSPGGSCEMVTTVPSKPKFRSIMTLTFLPVCLSRICSTVGLMPEDITTRTVIRSEGISFILNFCGALTLRLSLICDDA